MCASVCVWKCVFLSMYEYVYVCVSLSVCFNLCISVCMSVKPSDSDPPFCLGHGGGWGYSGHSIEAVCFMADTDILLGGFGLFGGRGEYFGKIKVRCL